MANPKKKLFMNFPGPWFVDSTCINCDACRQIAPETFAEAEDYAYVKAQPQTGDQKQKATMALVSCPTGSIGTSDPIEPVEAVRTFPERIQPDVYYCGFNSRSADGGNSFLITHAAGNWLIDSPRYHRHLESQFAEMGGIDFCFFTDEQYNTDSERYYERFRFQRAVHAGSLEKIPDAEIVIRGEASQKLLDDFVVLPLPGLPSGNQVLLFDQRILFSGRHVWWNPYYQRLDCPEYKEPPLRKRQKQFLTFLLRLPLEGIIPSHAHRVCASAGEMHELITSLIQSLSD